MHYCGFSYQIHFDLLRDTCHVIHRSPVILHYATQPALQQKKSVRGAHYPELDFVMDTLRHNFNSFSLSALLLYSECKFVHTGQRGGMLLF